MTCGHTGDHWWNHAEKATYCYQCNNPVPVSPPKSTGPFVGRGLRSDPGNGSMERFDHYGYPVRGGYWDSGADQT